MIIIRREEYNMTYKKINLKRIISILVAVALLITMIPSKNVMAANQGRTKKYMVFTNNRRSFAKAAAQIGDEAITENGSLEENNVILADLTETEADQLDKENGVLFVEEDFEIEANGLDELDEPDWEENPPLSRDEVAALKKKIREERNGLRNRENVEPEDYEWNMKAVDANEVETDSPVKIKVAVLDSGIDNVIGIELADSVNLVPEEGNISPMFLDVSGHGTGIASIIAGTAQNEVQGVNPNVDLYSVKVLDAMNKAPVSRIIEGIYWCIDNGIQIINMSFGTSRYSEALQNAVQEAYEAGILMIGASGNCADDVEYPAAFPEVMAVAATGTDAQITDFSNTGDELEIAAPGENVKVISYFGGNTVTAGTSISVPHVTGAASLLWQKDPSKSNEFIRQLLSYSAKNIANGDDCGLLDVEYALEIYDEFAENFDGTSVSEDKLPENTKEPETFEYISDDENYVGGRWKTNEDHPKLVEYGIAQNGLSITSERCKIMKTGAIYPDGISELNNTKLPNFHGKSGVNFVAVYEFITRIALKSGDTSTFTDDKWQSIPGMSTLSRYRAIRDTFVMKSGEPYKVLDKTWQQIFNYVDRTYGTTVGANYGKDSATDAKNRKYFIWGIAMHYISDSFAHDTYRKTNNTLIDHPEADNIGECERRYKVAKGILENVVYCVLQKLPGDWIDIENGLLLFPEKSDNKYNFMKSKLYTYMVQNGANTSLKKIASASIHD